MNVEARNRMVMENSGLVPFFAGSFRGATRIMDWDDIQQEGFLGLIRAVEMYDPAKGTSLSTYAKRWVKSKVGHAIDRTEGAVHFPPEAKRDLRSYRRAFARLQSDGVEPTFEQVAEATGIKDTHCRWGRMRAAVLAGAYTMAEDNDGELQNAAAREHDADRLASLVRLREARKHLGPDHRRVLELYLDEGMPFDRIDKLIGRPDQSAESLYDESVVLLKKLLLKAEAPKKDVDESRLASRPCHDCGTYRGHGHLGRRPWRHGLGRFGLEGEVACHRCFQGRERRARGAPVIPRGDAIPVNPCHDCGTTGGRPSHGNTRPCRNSLAIFGLPNKVACLTCYRRRESRKRRDAKLAAKQQETVA